MLDAFVKRLDLHADPDDPLVEAFHSAGLFLEGEPHKRCVMCGRAHDGPYAICQSCLEATDPMADAARRFWVKYGHNWHEEPADA